MYWFTRQSLLDENVRGYTIEVYAVISGTTGLVDDGTYRASAIITSHRIDLYTTR